LLQEYILFSIYKEMENKTSRSGKKIKFPDETKLHRILDPTKLQMGHEYLLFDGNVGKRYRGVYYGMREYPIGIETMTENEVMDLLESENMYDIFTTYEFLVFCTPQRMASSELSTSKMICDALKKGDTSFVKKYLEKIRKKDKQITITELDSTSFFDFTYDDVLDIYPYKAKRIVVRENGMMTEGEHGPFYEEDPVRIYQAQTPKILEKRENRTLKKIKKEKSLNKLPETLNKTVRAFLNPPSSSRSRSSSRKSGSSRSSSRSSRNINEKDIETIREYLRTLKYREKEVFTENEINKLIVELNKNPRFVRSKNKIEQLQYVVEKAYDENGGFAVASDDSDDIGVASDEDFKGNLEYEIDRLARGVYDDDDDDDENE
jgi:hypothetical protein